MWVVFLAWCAFLVSLVNAQVTQTVTNVNGQTVVEVVGTDPVALIPTTSIISTIIAANPATTATTASPATTTTALPTTTPQEGPVGVPGPTAQGTGGPTPFTYTTVIGGVTYTSTDVFTPTNPPTLPPSVAASGTIWNYSSWASIYGPQTTASSAARPNTRVAGISSASQWIVISFGTLAGIACGAWVALF